MLGRMCYHTFLSFSFGVYIAAQQEHKALQAANHQQAGGKGLH